MGSPVGSSSRVIGERIRARRRALGLSQAELAGDRVTKSFVSQVEKGHARPSLKTLAYFAERLRVPLAELLDDEEDHPEREAAWSDLLETVWALQMDPAERARLLTAVGALCFVHGRPLPGDKERWLALADELVQAGQVDVAARLVSTYGRWLAELGLSQAVEVLLRANRLVLGS